MAKKVEYILDWNSPDEVPEDTSDCYVTLRYRDQVWVQEGCYDEGHWGEYNPEYNEVDYFDHDYEVLAWAYKPDVQPCLDFVKEK